MLLFKKKFIEQIKSGEKTQTIRLWKYCRMKPGQRSYTTGVGYIRIDSIERVELEQLTDADAIPDGFPTADALREELCALYGADALKRLRLYIVRFSVCTPCEQERIKKKRADEESRRKLVRYLDFM